MTSACKMCMNCRFGIDTDIKICHTEETNQDSSGEILYTEYSIIHCKNRKKFHEELQFALKDNDDEEIGPDFTMLFTSHSIGCKYYEEATLKSGIIGRLWPDIWRH